MTLHVDYTYTLGKCNLGYIHARSDEMGGAYQSTGQCVPLFVLNESVPVININKY